MNTEAAAASRGAPSAVTAALATLEPPVTAVSVAPVEVKGHSTCVFTIPKKQYNTRHVLACSHAEDAEM